MFRRWTSFFRIFNHSKLIRACSRLCVCVYRRGSKRKISHSDRVKLSFECQPVKHWCFLWQQISTFRQVGLLKAAFLSLNSNPLHPSLCFGWLLRIHTAGSVVYCRCQTEEWQLVGSHTCCIWLLVHPDSFWLQHQCRSKQGSTLGAKRKAWNYNYINFILNSLLCAITYISV